jgi:hypothetical protein
MKMRYFVVDAGGQLRRASQAAVAGFWEGTRRAADLGCPAGSEVRLVSVVCDGDLLPRKLFLLRVPTTAGALTQEGRLTLYAYCRPDCVTPAESLRHHLAGWPADFFRQLAVALDVPAAALDVPLGVGGPLMVAAATGLAPAQAARLLR